MPKGKKRIIGGSEYTDKLQKLRERQSEQQKESKYTQPAVKSEVTKDQVFRPESKEELLAYQSLYKKSPEEMQRRAYIDSLSPIELKLYQKQEQNKYNAMHKTQQRNNSRLDKLDAKVAENANYILAQKKEAIDKAHWEDIKQKQEAEDAVYDAELIEQIPHAANTWQQRGIANNIKNEKLRSEVVNAISRIQEEKNFDMLNAPKIDDIFASLFDAALDMIPVVGEAKQLFGIKVGKGLIHCPSCDQRMKTSSWKKHSTSKKHLRGSGIFKDIFDNTVGKVASWLWNKQAKHYNENKKNGTLVTYHTGRGLGDVIQSGYEWARDKIIRNGYNNKSQAAIKDYGNWRIMKMFIYRKPIESALDKVLNFISLGTWQTGKNDAGYDKLFHLGLFCVLNDGKGRFVNVLCEKNAVIEITKTTFNVNSFGETMPVFVHKQLSLIQMLDGAQEILGEKYFKYDAFNENNCQVYVRALLNSAGLYKAKEEAFVFQPVDKILENMGAHVPKIARVVTDLGAIADRVIGGKLTIHRVNVNKNVPFDQALKHARNILKTKRKFKEKIVGNSYHFRAIPKTHFKKGSWVSKKINPEITIVMGELI